MNKNLSDHLPVSDLIARILDSEKKIKLEQANLYSLKDKLHNELNTFNSSCFDMESIGCPQVTVQVPDGTIYRITLDGLLIREVPVVEVA